MSGKIDDPQEVREMRAQLAEQRRAARGVKQSWRNLRAVPRSDALAAVVDTDLAIYDSMHPAPSEDSIDETTRRLR